MEDFLKEISVNWNYVFLFFCIFNSYLAIKFRYEVERELRSYIDWRFKSEIKREIMKDVEEKYLNDINSLRFETLGLNNNTQYIISQYQDVEFIKKLIEERNDLLKEQIEILKEYLNSNKSKVKML